MAVLPNMFPISEKVHLQTAPKSPLWFHCSVFKYKTGPDCFGHCRCLFSCHSLRLVLSLFSDFLLFCLSVPNSLSVCIPLCSHPPFPALPERIWPLGLASASLCHVCNLNYWRAKQGWATRKGFCKTRLSLKSLWTFLSEEWNRVARSHFLLFITPFSACVVHFYTNLGH